MCLFWCCLLCGLKEFLDLKVLLQRLQGMMIPSRWFASMWSFMFLPWPSFPQTWHRSANSLLPATLFWLFSIIDFTFSSSSSKSPEKLPGMATVVFSDFCLLKDLLGIFAVVLKEGFSSSSRSFNLSSVFPTKPFNWSSSAIARKKSR